MKRLYTGVTKEKPLRWALVLLVLSTCSAGCRSDAAVREFDPDLNRMLEVPRYDPYESSTFFRDGMAMRSPPEGTIPYQSQAPSTGRDSELRYETELPMELSIDLLETGKEKFEEVCAACHGVLGTGDTVVATHMQRPPPNLHQPRLRQLPLGKIYLVLTEGYGFMPAFASHFDERQRWAIAAYVRALQLSQYARLEQMPKDLAYRVSEELEP